MCGIVGYTGADINAVKRAHALQSHRGPDGAGFYTDEDISLGHNRLAIIDLNKRAAQPMWNNTATCCVVFNGEIYNYQELKERLANEYTFKTTSDTEVLLALYEKYGEDMCTHLRGMYAFAIYDHAKRRVFLARDPFGVKPLYYAYQNETLYFASEMKAMVSLFGSNDIPIEIDHESIQVYLTLGYTISPRTIYTNISMLEPGMTMSFDIDSKTAPIKKEMQKGEEKKYTDDEYAQFIKKKILSNLVADVPVGVFFSGGTDSSLIAATLHANGQDLETFSVSVSGRNADTYYFDKIAETLELKKNVYVFDTEEFDQVYQDVLVNIDNPSGSDSIFQSYFIANKASKKVKVVLLGDGGDELFGGYPRSFPLFKLDEVDIDRGLWLEWLYFFLPSFYAKNYLFLKLFKWFGSPVSYYLNAMSALRDQGDHEAWRICREHIRQRAVSPSQFDLKLYLQEGLLFKNDAATSFCSMEGRVPFLDPNIMTTSSQQIQKSIESGIGKYSLKKILGTYLPQEYVYRKKSGFGVSYKQFLQESRYLRNDYQSAVEGLPNLGIRLHIPTGFEKNYPHLSIMFITLWHALKNNQRIHTTARSESSRTRK